MYSSSIIDENHIFEMCDDFVEYAEEIEGNIGFLGPKVLDIVDEFYYKNAFGALLPNGYKVNIAKWLQS